MTESESRQHHEFGVVHVGDALPLYCGHCGFSCYCEENLYRHMRLHRAKRRAA